MLRRLMTDLECTQLEGQIINEFGNGSLEPGKYVWEQVLADLGFFVKSTNALQGLCDAEYLLLLERHPNNDRDAEKVARRLGQSGKRGFLVSKDELSWIISRDLCDLFVADLEGHLRLLACHEDEIRDGERLVWVPGQIK